MSRLYFAAQRVHSVLKCTPFRDALATDQTVDVVDNGSTFACPYRALKVATEMQEKGADACKVPKSVIVRYAGPYFGVKSADAPEPRNLKCPSIDVEGLAVSGVLPDDGVPENPPPAETPSKPAALPKVRRPRKPAAVQALVEETPAATPPRVIHVDLAYHVDPAYTPAEIEVPVTPPPPPTLTVQAAAPPPLPAASSVDVYEKYVPPAVIGVHMAIYALLSNCIQISRLDRSVGSKERTAGLEAMAVQYGELLPEAK